MRNKIKTILYTPLTYILLFSTILFSVGILWGLPNNESWLSDSLAPFHPLMGLSQLFSFGYLNKYPLVHQFILALLNLPVVIAALVNSNPLEGLEFMKFLVMITGPSYATALIIIDRLVSLVMGVTSVYLVYKISNEIFNKRVALFSSLIVAFNPLLNFYSHVAKVEVPYIFWGLCALYALVKIIKDDSLKTYKHAAIFACLSFGSKDQGYALFVLPFIYIFLIYKLQKKKKEESVLKTIFSKKNVQFLIYFILFTLLLQNIIFNYEGFLYRLEILTGWNVDRSRKYTSDLIGIWAQTKNSVSALSNIMTLPILLLSLTGIGLVFYRFRRQKETYALTLLLLLSSLSYYIFFLLVAKQTSLRQLMPISIFFSVYAGFAIHFIFEHIQQKYQKILATCALVLVLLNAFYYTAATNYFMLNDLRYSVEKWMQTNFEKKAVIEYYSYLHYLPRFPEGTASYRVKKNVLYIEKRKPDYIVLTSHYYTRFIGKINNKAENGEIKTTKKQKKFLQSDFPLFFEKLFNQELNYTLIKRFNRPKTVFQDITHARISPTHILIYKRTTQNN